MIQFVFWGSASVSAYLPSRNVIIVVVATSGYWLVPIGLTGLALALVCTIDCAYRRITTPRRGENVALFRFNFPFCFNVLLVKCRCCLTCCVCLNCCCVFRFYFVVKRRFSLQCRFFILIISLLFQMLCFICRLLF